MRSDILSVQHLRALAALAVLLFDAAPGAGLRFGPGAAGVDLFFVISGFIIWTVCSRRRTRAGDFLRRRLGRIAPPYCALALVVIAVQAWRGDLVPGLGQGSARLVALGSPLQAEALFYVAFALVLILPRGRRAITLSAALGALCFLGLVLPRGRWALLDACTDPRLLEFAAGVWLAKAAAAGRLGRTWEAAAAIAAGLAMLAVVDAIGVEVESWARLLCWGGPAVMIVWGCLSLEGGEGVPAIAPLKGLGDASYSLYLTHGLALSLAFKLLGGRGLPPSVQIALAMSLAVAAGVLCYRLVERPLLAMFHGRRLPAILRARIASWAFLHPKVQP